MDIFPGRRVGIDHTCRATDRVLPLDESGVATAQPDLTHFATIVYALHQRCTGFLDQRICNAHTLPVDGKALTISLRPHFQVISPNPEKSTCSR